MVYRADITFSNGESMQFYFKDWQEREQEFSFARVLRYNSSVRAYDTITAIRAYKAHILHISFDEDIQPNQYTMLQHQKYKLYFEDTEEPETVEHLAGELFDI